MDEIIPGAETIELKNTSSSRGGRGGVLLLHGFGDSPHSLRYLAAHLHAAGYSVRVPLMPGHGRTIKEFDATTAEHLVDFAAAELASMRTQHEKVALGGLSMGGAISSILAAGDDKLPALILIAPYLGMPFMLRVASVCAPALSLFIKQVNSQSILSVHDPIERADSVGYGFSTPTSVKQLWRLMRKARTALPDIHVPTLLIQSREDNRIAKRIAENSFVKLGADEKRLVFTEGAGHVITVDYGREKVFEEVLDWLNRYVLDS